MERYGIRISKNGKTIMYGTKEQNKRCRCLSPGSTTARGADKLGCLQSHVQLS